MILDIDRVFGGDDLAGLTTLEQTAA
ncbi:MAG TPA: chemotaxis protein CheW, partial [Geobacter sulfurreducens]|nr:chemotaxis protein CheW [Geobacter sulfurreducens]HCD95485.1 chemotaxis protein CheW [Geobacter sulfurreducens]